MARRLEIQLTSIRADGTWTWRAAGAKQPRGEVAGDLLPEGTKVGDVVRAEAEAFVDGLSITCVLPPRAPRRESERIELIGRGDDDPSVTTQLAPRRGRSRRDGDQGDRRRGRPDRHGGGRGRGGGRGDRDGGGRDRARGDRDGGGRRRGTGDDDRGGERRRARDGGGRRRQDDRSGKETSKRPSRPKPKRLRAARRHRQEAVKALPAEQRLLAEEILRGGVPGVRQAMEQMNDKAQAAGLPRINTRPLVALAETLAPALKVAEWHDRAEAALASIEDVDLRDIRSVVVAADSAARTEDTRTLAEQLRVGLAERVDTEHRKWLEELARTIADGRTVRALRLSSRPPKAGSPLPGDMARRLAERASAGLDGDVSQERWATVLDAVAFSPVRSQVTPAGYPDKPSKALLAAVRKVASRVPDIAKAFGVEAPAPRKRGRTRTPPPPPTGDAATDGSGRDSPAASVDQEAGAHPGSSGDSPGDDPTAGTAADS